MDAEPDSVLHSETAVPVIWVGYALGGAAASWAFAAEDRLDRVVAPVSETPIQAGSQWPAGVAAVVENRVRGGQGEGPAVETCARASRSLAAVHGVDRDAVRACDRRRRGDQRDDHESERTDPTITYEGGASAHSSR